MSSSLDGLAGNLAQVASRLRDAAAQDDGSLRRRHGATLTKLRILRDRTAAGMAPHDPRSASLAKVDAALADLTAAFNALPRAPLAIASHARPVQRRNRQRAARLDADTAKLLKRAAIVLGLSSAAALPMAAAAGSCTVGTTQTCTGAFTTGLDITGGALTAFVQSLTANITPASGTPGIKLDGFGSEGSHDGAGDSGDAGGPGPNLTLSVNDTSHTVTTIGDNATAGIVPPTGTAGQAACATMAG